MKYLSVITLTWNSEKDIESFLKNSIDALEYTRWNYEIIIIDNGSSDNTINIIEGFIKNNNNIILIPLWKNFGTTVTRNLGIRISSGQYVFIMDSDTKPDKYFFKNMILGFQNIEKTIPNMALLHPKLIYPDGTFQESARKFPTFKSKLFRLLDIDKYRKSVESVENVLKQKITPVHYAISACWVTKREIFKKIGLFDENIFYAPEDAEFCARLWLNNYVVMYYPYVSLIHDAKRLTKKRPFSKLSLLHIKGLIYFWSKYRLSELSEKVEACIKNYRL